MHTGRERRGSQVPRRCHRTLEHPLLCTCCDLLSLETRPHLCALATVSSSSSSAYSSLQQPRTVRVTQSTALEESGGASAVARLVRAIGVNRGSSTPARGEIKRSKYYPLTQSAFCKATLFLGISVQYKTPLRHLFKLIQCIIFIKGNTTMGIFRKRRKLLLCQGRFCKLNGKYCAGNIEISVYPCTIVEKNKSRDVV